MTPDELIKRIADTVQSTHSLQYQVCAWVLVSIAFLFLLDFLLVHYWIWRKRKLFGLYVALHEKEREAMVIRPAKIKGSVVK